MKINSKFMQTIATLILLAIPAIFIAGIINLTSGNDISSDMDTPSTLASVDIDTLCDSLQTNTIDNYSKNATVDPIATQDYSKLRDAVKKSCDMAEIQNGVIKRHNEMMKRLEQSQKNIKSITVVSPSITNPHIPPIKIVHGANTEFVNKELDIPKTAPLKSSTPHNETLTPATDFSK